MDGLGQGVEALAEAMAAAAAGGAPAGQVGFATVSAAAADGTWLDVRLPGAAAASRVGAVRGLGAAPGDRVALLMAGTSWVAVGVAGGGALPVKGGGTGGGDLASAQRALAIPRFYAYRATAQLAVTVTVWGHNNVPGWALSVPGCAAGDRVQVSWNAGYVTPSVAMGELDLECWTAGLTNIAESVYTLPGLSMSRTASDWYSVQSAGSVSLQMRINASVAGTVTLRTRSLMAAVWPAAAATAIGGEAPEGEWSYDDTAGPGVTYGAAEEEG